MAKDTKQATSELDPRSAFNFKLQIPEGDNRARQVCQDCGFIAYENPKIVAGAVVTHGEKLLLLKRAIEPRRGFWTCPAGFIEAGESPREGAIREAREEAEVEIELLDLLGIFTVPHLSQVQMFYRAIMRTNHFAAGQETLDAKLVDWSDIPWDELAFPSVKWALNRWQKVKELGKLSPFETIYQPNLNTVVKPK